MSRNWFDSRYAKAVREAIVVLTALSAGLLLAGTGSTSLQASSRATAAGRRLSAALPAARGLVNQSAVDAPGQPGYVTAADPAGYNDIAWSWENSPDTTWVQYASWAYGDPCGCWRYGSLGAVSGFDQQGLEEGTHYALEVADCNAAGCSAWSAAGDASTQLPAPGNLRATPFGQNEAGLTWTNLATKAMDLWLLWWQYGYSSQWTPVQLPNGALSSWTFPGLHPGTHYSFALEACTAAACSAWSNQADATTPLLAPTDLSVGPGPTAGTVSLAWQNNATNPGSDATLYLAWWQDGYSSQWTWVPVPSNTASSAVEPVTGGAHYAWVAAICTPAYGCSGWSNEANS